MTTALQESTGNSWFRAHHIHTHPSTVWPAITETCDSTAKIHVHLNEKWYFHCFAEYKHKNGFTFLHFLRSFFRHRTHPRAKPKSGTTVTGKVTVE